MAFDTGSPIGSTDARDLYDNAQNLDYAVNQSAARWTDRLGVSRPSWAGMVAYADRGAYAAGIEITGYNEIFLFDGEYYRAAASTTLPYTTTGSWSDDGNYFVSVGDASLRSDLVNGTFGPINGMINVAYFGTLEAARTSAEAVGKTILVTTTLTEAQSNITAAWPTDRFLRVEFGGSINPSTAFTGLSYAEPEWFGANIFPGTTDMTEAIQKAIDSLGSTSQSRGVVNFIKGLPYATTAAIRVRGGQTLNSPYIVSTSAGNVIESAVTDGTIYQVIINDPYIQSATATAGINMEGINNSTIKNPWVSLTGAGSVGILLKHGTSVRQCYYNVIDNPRIDTPWASGTAIKIEGTVNVSGSNSHTVIGGKLAGLIGVDLAAYPPGNPSARNTFIGTQFETASEPVVSGSIAVRLVDSAYNVFISCTYERYEKAFTTNSGSSANTFYRFLSSGLAFSFTDASPSTNIDYFPGVGIQEQMQKNSFYSIASQRYSNATGLQFNLPAPSAATAPTDVSWFRSTPAGGSNGGGTSLNIYAPNSTTVDLGVASSLRSGAYMSVVTWLGNHRVAYSNAAPIRGVWAIGDKVFNTAPASGAPTGWVCTTAGGAYSGTRANTTAYTVNKFVVWSTGASVWECTTAGTSGGSAPDITGKVVGDTVVDGTVTWTMRSLATNVWKPETNLP